MRARPGICFKSKYKKTQFLLCQNQLFSDECSTRNLLSNPTFRKYTPLPKLTLFRRELVGFPLLEVKRGTCLVRAHPRLCFQSQAENTIPPLSSSLLVLSSVFVSHNKSAFFSCSCYCWLC